MSIDTPEVYSSDVAPLNELKKLFWFKISNPQGLREVVAGAARYYRQPTGPSTPKYRVRNSTARSISPDGDDSLRAAR